jgi:hypothetical protein
LRTATSQPRVAVRAKDERRDVRADDGEQQQEDGVGRVHDLHDHPRPVVFDRRRAVGGDPGLQVLISVGTPRREALRDGSEFGLRLWYRDVSGKATEERDRRAGARGEQRSIGAQRQPETLVHREAEAFRHDADDGRRRSADRRELADDRRIAREPCRPETFADDRDERLRRLFVARDQRPAE